MVDVRLRIGYQEVADRYFWLRHRLAPIFDGLPPWANLVIDPVLAGGLAAAPLPDECEGGAFRAAVDAGLAGLAAAPPVPPGRREMVQAAALSLDGPRIEAAVSWAAGQLGLEFPPGCRLLVDVALVADGVPRGGVTGDRGDGPACFVAVATYGPSTLAELVVHEALHAVDGTCPRPSALSRLREEPGASPQLWHALLFVAAAEAVRRFIEVDHQDFGTTHGYYRRAADAMAALAARGLPVFTG